MSTDPCANDGSVPQTSVLENRDYTIIVAKTLPSISHLPPGYAQRWDDAQGAILSLVERCESYDPDGITLYLSCKAQLGFVSYKHVTSAQVLDIFSRHFPPTELNLLDGLTTALDDYFARKAAGITQPNGEIILVLIDGEPQQRMEIAKTIASATQKLERAEDLRIGFVQIGDDLIARGFLDALDNDLRSTAGAKFDIVTTQVLDAIPSNCLTEFLSNLVRNG
jgi:hypothetical protein